MGHGHRFRLGVVGVLGVVVVAGCSASGGSPTAPTPSPDATPSMSVSASPSASPSPSPSPSGPDIPAAARQQTDAGAEAFVKYFFEQFNVAWTEPRPGLIASLSDPDCQFCAKSETTARRLADQSQRYERAPLTLEKAEPFAGAPGNEAYLYVEFTQHGADIVDANGNRVGGDQRGDARANAALKWSGEGWRVLGIEASE